MKMVRSFALKAAAVAAAAFLAPQAASAQLFLYAPTFQTGTIEPNDPLVGLPMPGATPAEYRANMMWNMRSGLNVAALQCQFSPYLRTVDNYNALLDHHSRELAAAYTLIEGYFRRVHGRNGPRRFDDYSTQTYNNFSTFQAQLGFCQTAARLGREALSRRKGEFGAFSQARIRELRSSLIAAHENFLFTRMPVPLSPINVAAPDCSRLRGRERRECQRG